MLWKSDRTAAALDSEFDLAFIRVSSRHSRANLRLSKDHRQGKSTTPSVDPVNKVWTILDTGFDLRPRLQWSAVIDRIRASRINASSCGVVSTFPMGWTMR